MIKITKAGWIYIGLTIFLGVAAVNTGNNLIYLIVSAMLGFMGISGFFGRRNLHRVDIEIELPEEIFAKVETPIKVIIKNRKRFFPVFLLSFYFEGKKYTVPYIDPASDYEFHILHKFPFRGKILFTDFEICSVFPFNFFIRCNRIEKEIKAVIYPYPKKCSLFQQYQKGREKGEFSQSKMAGMQGDLISIRDYTQGDPLKYIHWKASAKTGELKTKELTELLNIPQIIDMEKVNIKDLEEKISCITYTIIYLFKKGIPFGLKAGKKMFPPQYSRAQKIKILNFLAEYKS